MLSDEECREIWQTSMARCHPMNDISVAGIRTAKAAFALGVEQGKAERARYEFICDRCGIRQQSKEQPEGAPF